MGRCKSETSQKTYPSHLKDHCFREIKAQVMKVELSVCRQLYVPLLVIIVPFGVLLFILKKTNAMRKLLLSLAVVTTVLSSKAQTTATFESLTLPKADTAYVNYSKPGTDVGFADGLAYFPCVYDTSGGITYWSSGYAYSNMKDSITSGYLNQYSAKTAKGFAGSNNYVVSYGNYNKITLTSAATGKAMLGMYITNSTYAYNSMRDGDAFAKKFKATDKDFFRLDVFGYRSGSKTTDSLSFYLADFRFSDSNKNYIVKDWQWLDLAKLGKIDSLEFRLQSSDNGTFGMNTPAYFCIDNFMTNETGLSIAKQNTQADFKIYPNPATEILHINSPLVTAQQIIIHDLMGRTIAQCEMTKEVAIDISQYAPGVYHLYINNGLQTTSARFVKQ
jgi:hypothetical protein